MLGSLQTATLKQVSGGWVRMRVCAGAWHVCQAAANMRLGPSTNHQLHGLCLPRTSSGLLQSCSSPALLRLTPTVQLFLIVCVCHTGEYPDLPSESAGGSKAILNPPLPTVEELIANHAAATAAAGGKGGAKGGAKAAAAKGGSRPASAAAAAAGAKPGTAKKGGWLLHAVLCVRAVVRWAFHRCLRCQLPSARSAPGIVPCFDVLCFAFCR